MLRLAQVLDTKHRARKTVTVSPDTTVREAMAAFCEKKVGALLVVDAQDRLVGIVTHRDILRQCYEHLDNLDTLRVGDFMEKDVIVGHVDDRTTDVLALVSARHIRHLPVVDGERIAGILSVGDILRALYQENEIKVRRLSDHLGGTYGLRVY
ncbi:MAG: CBS domain-containing protein [Kiritimatiellaeota bacterium]|nr:CBS domain-containing protein [Kiritimatiellota bacterium]